MPEIACRSFFHLFWGLERLLMTTQKTIQSMQISLSELKAEERRMSHAVSQLEQLLVNLQEAPTSKRRGRPPGKKKTISNAALVGDKNKLGKRRGRPPGSKNAISYSAAPVKGKTGKRRGRPPGQKAVLNGVGPVMNKRLGRPAKTAASAFNEQSSEREMT